MDQNRRIGVFHRQSEQFMCCNGKLHSKTGSAVVALCGGSVCLGALGLFSLEQFAPFRHSAVYIYIAIFATVIISLIFALKSERQLFLLPYIAFSIANVFLFITMAFFAIWSLSSSKSSPSKYLSSLMHEEPLKSTLQSYVENENIDYLHEKDDTVYAYAEFAARIILVSCSLMTAVLSIPFFLFSARVVYRCYNYFEAYHEAVKINEANPSAQV